MKKLLSVVLILTAGIADVANAAIPQFNFTCPGRIEVHADKGGPVFINGKQAQLKKFNNNYYEAKLSGVTISITISPDGTPNLSYTGPRGANGVCQDKAEQ